MTQSGGKMNKSLKAWVAFVKKVQKEEKLSYKDAIHRAKQRKDKGEKWMKGGADTTETVTSTPIEEEEVIVTPESTEIIEETMEGGRRRRSRRHRGSKRHRGSRRHRRTMRRSRRRYAAEAEM